MFVWTIELWPDMFILNGVIAATKGTSHQGSKTMPASQISFSTELPFSITMLVCLKWRHGGDSLMRHSNLYSPPELPQLALEVLIGLVLDQLPYWSNRYFMCLSPWPSSILSKFFIFVAMGSTDNVPNQMGSMHKWPTDLYLCENWSEGINTIPSSQLHWGHSAWGTSWDVLCCHRWEMWPGDDSKFHEFISMSN